MIHHNSWFLVLLAASTVFFGSLTARPAAAQDESDERGTIIGEIRDAEGDEPVSGAQVLLEGSGRFASSDVDGRFKLVGVPPGDYTLATFRIGYQQLTRRISVRAGDTLRLTLRLEGSPIVTEEVTVEGNRGGGEFSSPDVVMDSRHLRENLGMTVAETLDDEPGIHMRSMGPAPARPVLRGLGGERLMVLEDGGRTGDLSHTSSDHAVVIEPLGAERIEVIRGPSALAYGSNALGGIVNVERGNIPTSRPDHLHAEYRSQIESVNRGMAGGISVRAPVGLVAVQATGSARNTGDLHTPAGMLENTALATYDGSVGGSLAGSRGYVGLGGGFYRSTYGIPGGFTGAHPDGVNIDLERYHGEVRAEIQTDHSMLRRLETRGKYTWYHHREFEADGVLGIEFGVLSTHGSVTAHTEKWGPFTSGAVGISTDYRSYATRGLSFTPASVEHTFSGFVFQKARFGTVTLEGGMRADHRSVTPEEEDPSRTIGSITAPIYGRSFTGLSASVSASWEFGAHLSTGLRGMRSLRMPGIEELYSGGPHLAAYSFEVGDGRLELERGWGGEWFLRRQGDGLDGSLALYYNYVDNYIFPRNTGEPSRVQLPIYQHTGRTVRMLGGEASTSWRFAEPFSARGSVSYVRGTLLGSGIPLPEMPPLSGTVGLEAGTGPLRVQTHLRWAARQDRVFRFEQPRFDESGGRIVPEAPTEGYVVWDLSVQYHRSTGAFLHTIDVGLENVTNTEYRDHLSRVRVIMPEPGRNLTVQYRVYF